MVLAVNVGAVATPPASVVTVAYPLNFPLAPLAGAANVTDTPEAGLPFASVTVACSAIANAVFTATLCGVPAVAVIMPGGPAVLVRLKLAGAATPLVDASAKMDAVTT